MADERPDSGSDTRSSDPVQRQLDAIDRGDSRQSTYRDESRLFTRDLPRDTSRDSSRDSGRDTSRRGGRD